MLLLVIDGALTDAQRVEAFDYLTDETGDILLDEAGVPLQDGA